jgi:hypothetical protein
MAQWSHFSDASTIHVSTTGYDSWSEALTAAGAWLIAFRRRYGFPQDERPGKRGRDYQWLKEKPEERAPEGKSDGIPDRAGFGLPLPFGRVAGVAWTLDKSTPGRRASPLLLHVAQFENRWYLVMTHLPAALIPPGAKLEFRGTRSDVTVEQKQIVHDFLVDLQGKGLIRTVALS